MQHTLTLARNNLTKIHWFHSLPFQQFQALLTLFPKSFSSFPHGTCLLSVSNLYLALDEIYHPLCAPIPRNVTLCRHTVHGGLQMTNGTLALVDALFQEAYICASVGGATRNYKSRPEAPHTSRSKPTATLAVKQQAITLACNNLAKIDWFHSLPFQQFQALLTLFSKSFSSFPHGTC